MEGSVQEWLADTSPAPSRDSARLRGEAEKPTPSTYTIYRPEPVEVELVRNAKYPWHSLRPGDHFIVPCEPEEADRVRNSVRGCGNRFYYARDWGISTRIVNDGVRVDVCWGKREGTA